MPSWKKPTKQQIDEVVRRLIESGHYSYFFAKLQNPEWIEPLLERKFFRSPPPLARDAESGRISMPRWPESAYLARMAGFAPEQVIEVLMKMPPTDNGLVLEDFTDALNAMPPEIASKMVSKASQWARTPFRNLLGEKLGRLMARMAQAHRVSDALKLAKAILAVPSDEAEARGTMEEWEHSEILKNDFPAVLEAAPKLAMELLCDLLRDAVQTRDSIFDYSVFWRPAIERHEQNSGDSSRDNLVNAIVDGIEMIVGGNPDSIADILAVLRRHSQQIFLRIELHTLQGFGESALTETIVRLTDRTLFEDPYMKHEYAGLLRAHFLNLPAQDQSKIRAWIEAGPDVENYIEWFRAERGTEPTSDEIAAFQGVWQRDKIAWFGDVAPKALRQQYEALVGKYGEPQHPDFAVYSTTSWGPTSPKSQEQLKGMLPEEVIGFLSEWRSDKGLRSPTEEGLARELEGVIATDPAPLAGLAHKFVALPPIYASRLLNALVQTKWDNRSWDWAPIFVLLDFIADQCVADSESPECTWREAKLAAARLLDRALTGSGIEFAAREKVWHVLKCLTSDPDPAMDDADQWSRSEPWTQAINTVRGEAMHAAMQYGLWCRRELKIAAKHSTLDQAPELRELLDDHLATDNAPAIRAVYGQFYPWLQLLDRDWARSNAAEIFPTSADRQQLWYAAWGSYLLFDSPYDEVLEDLRYSYRHSCAVLANEKPDWQSRDVDEPLARHIMTYFWRGKLEDDDGRAILDLFWKNARPETRVDAIQFVGRSLAPEDLTLSEEQRARMMRLWEWRLSEGGDGSEEELANFGHWFTSKVFAPDWSLRILSDTLEKAGSLRDLEDILQQLPNYAAILPLETAQLLLKLVQSSNQPWAFDYRENETKETLTLILDSEIKEAQETGRGCVNLLAARGHISYRSLLSRGAKG